MPAPSRAPVQFKDRVVEQQLAARSQPGYGNGAGAIAARDLARYYAILAHELARLPLSEAEASLIVDALNGTLIEPHTAGLIWASVDDAIRGDGLDRKWAVDGPALVSKLRDLPLAASLALADAVERFWAQAGEGEQAMLDRLVAVGLIQRKEA